MLTYNQPYLFWSVWHLLSAAEKLFSIALTLLIGYTASALVSTLLQRHLTGDEYKRALPVLRRRSSRVQNLKGVAFCSYGVALFWGLQCSYVIFESGKQTVTSAILENLGMRFVFGFNACCALLILQVLGSLLAASVERFGLKAATHES